MLHKIRQYISQTIFRILKISEIVLREKKNSKILNRKKDLMNQIFIRKLQNKKIYLFIKYIFSY